MTSVTKKKAEHLIQMGTGATWNNLSWANTGDDHASYVYPQGKNSSTNYKPKTLVYNYMLERDFFPSALFTENTYKINSLKFVLVIGKFNINHNDLPHIQVLVPKKINNNTWGWNVDDVGVTISSYKKLDNYNKLDTYTLEFDLTDAIKNVPINKLSSIGIKVIWDRTKINGDSTISINRARIKGSYTELIPKFSTYDKIDCGSTGKTWIYNNETMIYKLTAKNTGYSGTGTTKITFPKGCTIVSAPTSGWNNSTKTVTYTLSKGQSKTFTFKLKLKNIGINYIKTVNNSIYTTNLNTRQMVSVLKKATAGTVDPAPKPNRKDIITYYFPTSFAKESSYFDVKIQGFKENHLYGLACYTLHVPNNIITDEPLRLSTELLDNNSNIKGIIRDSSFVKHGITVEPPDNAVCLDIENENADFVVNLRFPIYCTTDDDATISIDNTSDVLEIYPVRKSIFDISPSISKDKKYVQNSINIGSPEMWTIRAKGSRHNFFETKKELFEIGIEKLIAYIGCIPLTRGHLVGDEASVKNTLIENRHNNRAYYGKKGDFSEDIGMTLRLPPADVATLEGLCELDKPIPIDTVPHIPDGDPLNHRGWAELHGVNSIKKINSFLYECKPEVTYLTHDLITKFGIDEGAKIASNNIEYFLGLTHNFGDNLLDYFNLNYYNFFTNIEDDNGDYIGEYNLEPNSSLIFNSINKLSNRGNYDIKYRNILPALMSENLDGNWSMAVRILDRNNRTPLFEHLYDNFKHYDFDEPMVLNECDVTTRVRNGNNFDIVNYDRLRLTYDGLASLTELKKSGSYFNKIESDTYNMENNLVETFLYDKDNNPIINGKVKVIIKNNENYYDTFNVLSDIDGKIEFPLNLNNGRYTINMIFEETEEYKGCEYTFSALVEYEVDEYHFDYPNENMIINSINATYPVKLLDANNAPASGMIIYYSFKGLGESNYSYENKLITDSNGIVNIPINFNNGSKFIKVAFKGFIDSGVIYPSCYFESMVNINIEGKDTVIEADDVELTHGDNNKIYNIILKDAENNTTLSNKNVTIGFYNDKENYVFDVITNNFGVATIPIYLGVGNWFVDVHFKGDNEYKPNIVNKNIIINNFIKHDVNISSENLLLNENRLLNGEDDYYKITLKDENGNFIVNEPITFKVWDINKNNKYVDTILYSNNLGEISFPYVTNNENVIIESYYEGSNSYNTSFNSDIVTFENVLNKSNSSFSVDSEDVYITQGSETVNIEDYWEDDDDEFDVNKRFTVIITEPENNRLSDKGMLNLMGIQNGYNYNVTVFYTGNNSYHSKCQTLNFTPNRPVYPSNPDGRMAFRYYLIEQEYPAYGGVWSEDVESLGKLEKGELFTFRIKFEFTHGKVPLYLGVGNADTTYTGFNDFILHSDYVLKSMPIKYYNDDKYVEYVEFTGVMPSNGKFFLCCKDSKHHGGYGKHLDGVDSLVIINSTKSKQSIIEQSGFGNGGETYQNIIVSSLAEDDPTITTNTNDYYLMKLFNNDTYEELFFYSYLNDIVTSTKLNFMISENNWDLLLLGSGNSVYKSDYYILNDVVIDTPSSPAEPTVIDGIHNTVEVDNDLFFNDYNYSNIDGTDIDIDIDNKELNLEGGIPTYETLFEDDCTIDNTSQYSETVKLQSNNNAAFSLSYDSNNQYYNIVASGADKFIGKVIPTIQGRNKIKISCEVKLNNSSAHNQFFIGMTDTLNNSSVFDFFRIRGDRQADYVHNSGSESWSASNLYTFNGNFVKLEVMKVGTVIVFAVFDMNDHLLTRTVQTCNEYSNPYFFIGSNGKYDTDTQSIRNLKVTSLEPIYAPSISYINPNTLPDYNYVLKHNITLNNGIEIFDYNTIDVLNVNKEKYNTIIEDISNGIIITEINNTPKCIIKKDNEILFNGNLTQHLSYDVEYKIYNDLCDIYINDTLIYKNYKLDYNTLLLCAIDDTLNVKKIHLYENNEVVDEFTESVDSYEGKTFGSDIYFELKNNILNFIDYGMLPEGGSGSSKIILNDIKLLETDYELEIEINYDNRTFMRLNDLEGYLRFRAYEDVSVKNNLKYSNILCSPVPIPDSITRFTRHSDEGTMYYVETPITDNKKANLKYLCNPYIQYKGGTELNSETGISLFNLDNGISPVSVDNGLVKAEFHRRSGYIVIYRYDDKTDMWYKCNIFKLSDNPQLELWKYTDDMCEIHFGKTVWKLWRGRPFIQIQHPNDDFRILNLVDRVYCETVENEITMGFVEEHDTNMSVFDPKTSIQLFKEEWCIGENIKTDNFKLFNVINNNNVDYLNYDITLSTIKENNDKLLSINRNENQKIALNFPASPVYVKKPSSTFSLLINNFKSYDLIDDVIIKCRGFDESGCIHEIEGIQYGIWEDSKSVSLNGDYETGETIRVTFDNVPNDVKYIDFVIIIPKAENSVSTPNILMNGIMLYEGADIDIEPKRDTSKANATRVEINFNETYYANLYDDDAPCGLCIVRPYKENFTLRKLRRAKETVLIPYMKKCSEWDKPENIFIEYFNSKEQIINIDWEN